MARRRIIEGRWSCSSCDSTGILGRHKVCPQCGNPREQAELHFDFGERTASGASTRATVEDAKLRDLAEAGADWMCAQCEAGNRGDARQCRQCGAPRHDAPAPPAPRRPSRAAPPPRPPPRHRPPLPPPPSPSAYLQEDLAFYEAQVARSRRNQRLAVGGIGAGIVGLAAMIGGYAWVNRPLEVIAEVERRTYVREVLVERLTPSEDEDWRERLPRAAVTPGSPGETLRSGLGAILGCETHQCYARPPDFGRLVEVTGRRWRRTVRVQGMHKSRHSGWESEVPSGTGDYPSAGSGGSPGRYGSADCRRKEREPERCRTESNQVQCGTEESCTVNDLGNGFAEEVCHDVPTYCTETEEVCEPAVYDDWCTWSELSWASPTEQSLEGTMDRPRWPTLRAGPRERRDEIEENVLEVEHLAGVDAHHATVAAGPGLDLLNYDVGEQLFVSHKGALEVVPPRLRRRGEGPFTDCDFDIPAGVLHERDRCRFTRWSWVQEPPRVARDDPRPDWPDPQLGEDGRSERREWAEVVMGWSRGKKRGAAEIELTPEQADLWSVGTRTPIEVDANAEITEYLGAWPGREAPDSGS